MTKLTLTAGVLAAALAAGAGAQAADLDYGRVPTDRYSSAYEDPRYRDLYAPAPEPYAYEYRYKTVPPPAPVPPAYVYRDHPAPYRDHRDQRYSQYDEPVQNGCVPRDEIKRRMISEGWRDFHDLELRQNVAKIRARRPSGDLYDLKVDRCTGEIIHSQILKRGSYGPYASDDSPRRWERYY